jgi:hypothetical protein
MIDSNEEEENIESITLRSKLGSNDVNSTPIKHPLNMSNIKTNDTIEI